MKILITGSKGQLGNELARCLQSMRAEIGPIPEAYEHAAVDYVDLDDLDISDENAVFSWFSEHGPYDLTVNCAAMTNVDGCESAEASAFMANALGPLYLARASAACEGALVHISTDYVFPGNDPDARSESDAAQPISAYGRTKWAGELLALDANPRTFVVRTAWLYGYIGRNFVKTMLRLARERGAISVVADQFGNPTNANDLAYEILKIALTNEYGIWHCTNNGTCSWFDFACSIMDAAGIDCAREPLSSAAYKERFPQSADRPAYSSLDNARLRNTVGDQMRPWKEALETYVANLAALGD